LDAVIAFFKNGGTFMYIILTIGLWGIAIIVERFIVIYFVNRIDSKGFTNQVVHLIRENKIDKALSLCDRSKAALPRIVRAGLEEADSAQEDIQNAIELRALTVFPKLEKRTGYLSMAANVATLLGLLGTIWGLIQSFQAVAHADASQKAALLTGGIALALNTTAFGLIVAIPIMFFYSILLEKTNEVIDEINENVGIIFQALARRTRSSK